MNEKFKKDYQEYVGSETYNRFGVLPRLLKSQSLRYVFYGRLSESTDNKIFRALIGALQERITRRSGIEMDFSKGKIGGGLLLAPPFNITVNYKAILGEQVILFKGCTIGSIRSGKREGTPIIGDRVVICCNAMVCGGIHIGSDVLIAANSFVDFDVPDHSIVLGNPGHIIAKENAVSDYIKEKQNG